MALITMQAICNESNAFQNAKTIISGKMMLSPLNKVDFMVPSNKYLFFYDFFNFDE